MQATINGNTYHIEFSYRRRSHVYSVGDLAPSSPVKGLATCAIVKMPSTANQSPLISVASVVCSPTDNWSKRDGRWFAFDRAVESCGVLRKQELEFTTWFDQRFPNPAKQRSALRKTLSQLEKQVLFDDGKAKRLTRERGKVAGND